MATIYTVGNGKTYSTIQDAVDALPGDLTGSGVHRIEVYAGGVQAGDGYFYDENVSLGLTITTQNDYVEIIGMVDHKGLRDTGIIIRSTGILFHCLATGLVNYTRIRNIAFTGDHSQGIGPIEGVLLSSEGCWVDKCLFYDIYGEDGATGISVDVVTELPSSETIITNCFIQNIKATAEEAGATGILFQSGMNEITNVVANCTIHNISHEQEDIKNYGIYGNEPHTIYVHNTSATNLYPIGYTDYAGDAVFYINYSISSDNSADAYLGGNNQTFLDPITALLFVNPNIGEEDLHLSSKDSFAFDTGDPNSPNFMPNGYEYDYDIDGDSRPCFSLYDVGADELCIGGSCCDTCCCCVNKRFKNRGR